MSNKQDLKTWFERAATFGYSFNLWSNSNRHGIERFDLKSIDNISYLIHLQNLRGRPSSVSINLCKAVNKLNLAMIDFYQSTENKDDGMSFKNNTYRNFDKNVRSNFGDFELHTRYIFNEALNTEKSIKTIEQEEVSYDDLFGKVLKQKEGFMALTF